MIHVYHTFNTNAFHSYRRREGGFGEQKEGGMGGEGFRPSFNDRGPIGRGRGQSQPEA